MSMHDHRDKPVRTEDLVAHAEGRLPAGSALRARVEAHLRRHPDDAARVQAYRHQDALIREAFDDIALQPIPDRLVPGSTAGGRGRPRAAPGMAAMLVAGIALGWLAAQLAPPEVQRPAMRGFAERVADRLTASPGSATSTTGVTAPAGAGGVPDLAAAGLQPVGMGETGGMGARRYDYRDADGNLLHLFVSRDIAAATPSVRTLEPDTLAYWHDAGVTYVLGGQVSGERLVTTARRVRAALAGGATPVVTSPPATTAPAEKVIAVTPDPGGNGGNGGNDAAGMSPDSGRVAVPDRM